jgi:hypothetical protein
MTNLKAKTELERLQRNVRIQLSREARSYEGFSPKGLEELWRQSPDSLSSMDARMAYYESTPLKAGVHSGEDENPSAAFLLSRRIHELRTAVHNVKGAERLGAVCFGTILGGGLDAFAFKANGAEEYGIVIPDGLFNLVNLFTKLVVLLQPIVETSEGLIYRPSAGFAQFRLVAHPYIKFRHRDLLDAYLSWGDPEAALPYGKPPRFQDRFAYLLTGTELFVLAHEAAHVILGHLKSVGVVRSSIDLELEADSFAVKILTNYFATFTDVPEIRAGLCAFFFLSLNRMLQKAVHFALGGRGKHLGVSTHPGYEQRFDHFVAEATKKPVSSTPGWFGLVFNAIRLATETMSDALIPELIGAGGGLSAISARVLPVNYSHLGRHDAPATDQWARRVAELLLSSGPPERLLGLWFLVALKSFGLAVAFYEGLRSDDLAWQDTCRRVLISVEPMYESYMPRLMKLFEGADRQDELDRYIRTISSQLLMSAIAELGDERVTGDPMDAGFFEDLESSE